MTEPETKKHLISKLEKCLMHEHTKKEKAKILDMAHFSAFAAVKEKLDAMGLHYSECGETLDSYIDNIAVTAVAAAEVYYESLSCEFYFGDDLEKME